MTNFNEYLQYDPETGIITWIQAKNNRIKVGQIAGTINHTGYLHIRLDGKLYQAHRLAWFLYYGKWPTNHIDHINGIKTDNRINNLRDVTRSENQLNRKGHRDKTYKYYNFHKQINKWQVQKRIEGKQKHLGCFETEELARQFVLDNVHLFPGAKPL
jgi:hypothetical protein